MSEEKKLKCYGYKSPFNQSYIAFAYDLESAIEMFDERVNRVYNASEKVRDYQINEFDIPDVPTLESIGGI